MSSFVMYNGKYMEFSLGGLVKSFKSAINPKKSVLGLDIGSSFIKLVQLKKDKERAILETYGELALGPYAKLKIGQNVKLPTDIVAQAIKDLMKESNSHADTVRVSIPLTSSFVKIITLPFGQDKNVSSEVVGMEARRHIPIPISEVALDWWVIPENENDIKSKKVSAKEVEVLLVAIHNDVIKEYKDIMVKTGLKSPSFEIETFGLIRSAIGRGSPTMAVMDIGSASVKMAIVDYGVMKSATLINKGSQDITLALSQSLGVDFSKAEEMKREIGLSDLPEHQDIVAVEEPVLEYIFHEAAVFLKDFQNRYGRSVSKVIFTGGGSMLKGLETYGVKRLAVEVERANPFGKTEHPAFLSGVLKNIGPDFSVATGLALGEL